MKFPKQEYWSGLPFPSPGDLPVPGIKPTSLMSTCISRRVHMVNVNDRIMDDFLFLTCFFQIFLLSVLFLVVKKHTFLLSYLIRLLC